MSRYTHDCSRTVISQYIVRKPDRHFRSIERIDAIASSKYASLFLILKTIYVGLHGSIKDILLNCFFCLRCCQRCCHRMFRCKYHEGSTMKSIRAGGVNGDLVFASFNREMNLSTVRFSDPVTLHLLYLFRPIQFIQIVKQSVRILGNTEHPLAEIFLCYLSAAPLTFSIDNLFICKSCLTGRTPVDWKFLLICKTIFEHLNKNPLCPLIEFRICGIYFHVPIIDRCNILNLPFDVCNIVRCRFRRMYTHLYCIIFSRKTKCIPSHRVNDIIAIQQFISAPYIRDHITSPVAYM